MFYSLSTGVLSYVTFLSCKEQKEILENWHTSSPREREELAPFSQWLHLFFFLFLFLISNNVCHRGLFCRLLLYELVHMGETNSALKEAIGKYIIVYSELQRKTAIHNARYVPRYAPWISLFAGILVYYMLQLRSQSSCIIILLWKIIYSFQDVNWTS